MAHNLIKKNLNEASKSIVPIHFNHFVVMLYTNDVVFAFSCGFSLEFECPEIIDY